MNRRGFLGSILALGAAPAIVRADSLMRILPMETIIIPRAPLISAATGLPLGMVREIWAYDIRWDRIVRRYDVRGTNRTGEWVQQGVDIAHDSGVLEPDPMPALNVLRHHVEQSGIKLEPWSGLPPGVEGRFL